MTDFEKELQQKMDDGLINEFFMPIKCECGSINLKNIVVDMIEYIETEKERVCVDCGSILGRWVYGNWSV